MFYVHFKNTKEAAIPDDVDLVIIPDRGIWGHTYWKLMAGDKLVWASLSKSVLTDVLSQIHTSRLRLVHGITIDIRELEKKHKDEIASALDEIHYLRTMAIGG